MRYVIFIFIIFSCTTISYEKPPFMWLEKNNSQKKDWLRKENIEYLNYKNKYNNIIKTINSYEEPKLNVYNLKYRIGNYIFYINKKGIYYKEIYKKTFVLFKSIKNLKFKPKFITTNYSKYLIIKGSKFFNDKNIIQIWDIKEKKIIEEFSARDYPDIQATSNNLYFPSFINGKMSIKKFNFINKKTTNVSFKPVYSFWVVDKSKVLLKYDNGFFLSSNNTLLKLFKKEIEFIGYNENNIYFYKNGTKRTIFYKFSIKQKKLQEIYSINKNIVVTNCILNNSNIILSFIYTGKNNLSLINTSTNSEKQLLSNKLASILINKSSDGIIITYSSFRVPKMYYLIKKNELLLLLQKNNINKENYKTVQKWVKYKNDSIPIILYYKDKIKKNSPLILYGYGGFKRTITPDYSKYVDIFIESGGIYAIAGIRGGGEMGINWHNQAIKKNKKQSFYDFSACLDYIIKNQISSPHKIAVIGSSNGGLLVNYSILEYNSKFKVAISMKGLSDMVNYNKYGMGKYWINEYGNPKYKNMRNYLKSYSPLHNLHKLENKDLTVLFITGDKDDRVFPIHTYKFTYGLKKYNSNAIYLKTIKNIGHSLSEKKTSKLYTEIYAFIFYNLNVKIKAHNNLYS